MNTGEILAELRLRAKKSEELKKRLLATKDAADPISAFCEITRGEGLELWPIELVTAGEEAYAAMRRSTNGGGENSPLLDGEDDYYELFLADLK